MEDQWDVICCLLNGFIISYLEDHFSCLRHWKRQKIWDSLDRICLVYRKQMNHKGRYTVYNFNGLNEAEKW